MPNVAYSASAKKNISDHVFAFYSEDVTSSSLRICSSGGEATGGVGGGAGVGTRSAGAGVGVGVGVVGAGVGCACDDSDALDGDADPGFAGSEG